MAFDPCDTQIMAKARAKATPKEKRKPTKRQPREDFAQAAFRALRETIRRSES